VILFVWFFADPPIPSSQDIGEGVELYCSSKNRVFEKGITWTLFCINALLLVAGVFLAIKTRKVDSDFNESRYIGFAIYNVLIIGCVVIPLISIPDITSTSAVFAILCLGIILTSAFTVMALFVPKILFILFPQLGPRKKSVRGEQPLSDTSKSKGVNKGSSKEFFTPHKNTTDEREKEGARKGARESHEVGMEMKAEKFTEPETVPQ